MARHSGSPAARTLGAELRAQRNHAGVATRRMAELLDIPRSRLTRWESGQILPPADEAARYLGVLRTKRTDRERIMALAHEAAHSDDDWLTSRGAYGRGVDQELVTLVEYERTATAITECSPLVIPGLLQTPSYAEAVLSGLPPDLMSDRLELRMQRRPLLHSTSAPEYRAFIGEPALRTPFGGHAVLCEQLEYLAALPEDIALCVLPNSLTEFTPAHCGPWMLFEFPSNTPPLVHLEHYASASFLTGTRSVHAYQRAAVDLSGRAMGPTESRGYIAAIRDEMEGT